MNSNNYLIIHKDHLMDVNGVNSGAEMATLFLARYLVRMGKRVVVAAQLKGGKEQVSHGVEFWDLGSSFDTRSAAQRAREELGYYHLISAGRAQALFEVRADEACVSRTLISHDRSGNDTGIQPSVLCEILDQVVCVSQAQKDVFVSAGADESKVHVVHNGVDLDLFAAGDPNKRDYKRLVFVGALVQDKGVDVLIASFANLLSKYPDITLDIYGSAGLWGRGEIFDPKAIEAQVPGVTFHGAVTQDVISKAYQTAGICVVPSIWFDPFPLTSIEAQATGCPVVTFDVGGLGEGVLPGCGVVLEEIGIESLTRSLDSLLSNPEQLRRMSETALEKARAYYRWERVASSLVEFAEQAAAQDSSEDQLQAELESGQFAVLTTWNQECGLATYANYLLSEFEQESYLVLAEQSDHVLGKDEDNVIRCWSRESSNYSELAVAIEQNDIKLLYLNAHARFFKFPEFTEFANAMRQKGVRIVAHLHSVFTLDDSLQQLAQCIDSLVVHTDENRLEAIANGAPAEQVVVIPHGVDVKEGISDEQRPPLRAELGLPRDGQMICCFGFVQPHKGMEGLIEAVRDLRANGFDVFGVLAGSAHSADPNSVEYMQGLKELAVQAGVGEYIHFVDRFIRNDEVTTFLQASDLVLMNYHSQHYEASGACSLAVGAGALVATSVAPPFAAFGDAVWHISSGFPVSLSAGTLLASLELQTEIRANARRYAEKNSWKATRKRVERLFRKLNFKQKPIRKEIVVTQSNNGERTSGQNIRVLIQSRPNSFTQRGGDTVVLEKLADGLKARGVDVTVDVENQMDPANFDIVHLFNFVLPELLRKQAERAVAANVPFVVTTLNEDVPHFLNQSAAAAQFLTEYVRRGQDKVWFNEHFSSYFQVEGCAPHDNSWVVKQAAALLTNGENESESLRRDYGNLSNLHVIRLGCDIGVPGNPALFENEFNIKDFVLCVGRIESRKNQLMLLKALEDVDVPVVIAGGGFTYQPDYAQAVQAFRRVGQTIVTGRLSDEMLASAYAAAKVHALPSWYELPGLVSLEAAWYGCNVVATERGTARDYLGEKAFYCDPADENSVRNAVMAAFYGPKQEGLDKVVQAYTWQQVAEDTYRLYQQICPRPAASATATSSSSESRAQSLSSAVATVRAGLKSSTPAAVDPEFSEWLEKGEAAAQEKDFSNAHTYLQKAEELNGSSARVLRARAAVFMAEENHGEARRYFERSFSFDSQDPKTLSGLGMCEMMDNRPEQAYPHFVSALERDASQMVAILQLIECAYRLERYEDLERVLERYVREHPEDIEMQFCYAGCLFKLGRLQKAKELAEHVQSMSPNHLGAKDLLQIIAETKPAAPVSEPSPAPKISINPEKLQAPVLNSQVEQETVQEAPRAFGSIDRQIVELEDQKKRRDFDAVLKGCDDLLTSPLLTPEQKEAVTLLRAEALVFLDRTDEAEVVFRQVLCDNPKSARAMCGEAAIRASKADWTKARELFEEANRSEPGFDVPLAGLGMCAASMNDKEEAWMYYRSALKLNQENTSALLGLIELAYQTGQFAELEEAIQGYLDMHPADLNFLYSLAGCLYAQGKLTEAMSEVQKITLFDPQHQHALELKRIIDEKLDQGAVVPQG